MLNNKREYSELLPSDAVHESLLLSGSTGFAEQVDEVNVFLYQ